MAMRVTLFLLTLTVLCVSAAPVKRDDSEVAKIPKFKIWSSHSMKLLSVTPSGDVQAKASDWNDPSTDFYLRTHGHDTLRVSYESVHAPGTFLYIDEETGQIRAGVPEDDNEKLLQTPHPHDGYALRSEKNLDCHIAFDRYGSVPTNPSVCDPQIQTHIHSSIRVIESSLF